MAANLILLRLNKLGQMGTPLAQLTQAISRLDVDQIVVVGKPDREAETAILSFKNSGIPVQLKPQLSDEEDQHLAMKYNVTAIVSPDF